MDAKFDIEKHTKGFSKGLAVKQQLPSIMAILTLIGALGSKRLKQCMENGDAIPAKLRATIKEAMDTCSELNLVLPGSLQAKATHFSKE